MPDGLKSLREWNLWVPIGIAGVPAVLAAGQIFILTRGERKAFSAVLASSNLAAVWINSAMNAIVSLVVLSPSIYIFYRIHASHKARHDIDRSWTQKFLLGFVLGLFQGVVIWLASASILGSVGSIPAVAGMYLLVHWRPNPLPYAQRRYQRAGLIISVGLCALGLILFSSGLPLEMVKVAQEPNWIPGYVVNVDDVSLTLLYEKGGIRRIPVGIVEGRILCPGVSDVTGAQFLLRSNDRPSYVAPECPYIDPLKF